MKKQSEISLVVVGSVALDTVATPAAQRADVLGGSVSYACAAASFFTRVGMVGVVGGDFPARCLRQFRRFGMDLRGLQKVPGKTFRWSGVYERNMNVRRTLSTELNVFAAFMPELPPAYRHSPFLFLANIAPDLQLHVLAQMHAPRFVAADTMDLWIRTARRSLMKLIAGVHVLLVNDEEVRQLTGDDHLLRAARRILTWGPRYVIVKKGEHGCMLISKRHVILIPAYPVEDVRDPTGAGDAFAGGFLGCLARERKVTEASLRRAMLFGTVVASFAVEAFSLARLLGLRRAEIGARALELRRMARI